MEYGPEIADNSPGKRLMNARHLLKKSDQLRDNSIDKPCNCGINRTLEFYVKEYLGYYSSVYATEMRIQIRPDSSKQNCNQ